MKYPAYIVAFMLIGSTAAAQQATPPVAEVTPAPPTPAPTLPDQRQPVSHPQNQLMIQPPIQYQSTSLYLTPGSPTVTPEGKVFNPFMQQASYLAVAIPEPRRFATHDLVTIIVRTTASGNAEGDMSTKKNVKVSGQANAFIDLAQLLEARVVPAAMEGGIPKVEVGFGQDFTGDGDYSRKDEIITRLTAQVIDVKPNGVLALEARMHMANDDETVTVTVTGYCRAEDVGPDNSVLSTQLHDLRVNKQHTGEIRNASEKGVLTKAMEFLFNF